MIWVCASLLEGVKQPRVRFILFWWKLDRSSKGGCGRSCESFVRTQETKVKTNDAAVDLACVVGKSGSWKKVGNALLYGTVCFLSCVLPIHQARGFPGCGRALMSLVVPDLRQSCVLQVEAGRDHAHRQAIARALPGGHHRGGRRRGMDRHADRSREAGEGCAYLAPRRLFLPLFVHLRSHSLLTVVGCGPL